jgi:hypothetical protein
MLSRQASDQREALMIAFVGLALVAVLGIFAHVDGAAMIGRNYP